MINSNSSLKMNDIINAIPKEIDDKNFANDSMESLIARISSKTMPFNSIPRLWILGSMQAKIAIGYLAYSFRSNFVNKTEKQRLLNETNLKTALKLLGTMSYLRGIIMKAGQVLSNIPHVIPEEISDIIGSLQFEAPPMHYSLIREVLLDELGREPEEIFASFDKKAFAAASIGQVHRAKLKNGEDVAVKIQYPNIAKTIQSDMNNLRAILQPMHMKSEYKFLIDHLKDAEKMFMVETDYIKEANFMKKVKKLFTDEDKIIIPGVYDEYSTKRVLTMDFIPGCHLKKFLSSKPDQNLRNHHGELISKCNFRIFFKTKTMYSDLNPGNFIFMDGGKLGVIDFGNQRNLSDEKLRFFDDIEKAILNKDLKNFDKLMAEVCLCSDFKKIEPGKIECIKKLSFWQLEPIMENKIFDFGNTDYYKSGIEAYTESIRQQTIQYDSLYNWWQRLIIGHRTLLYRLRSKFNYYDVYKKEQENTGGI